jgi:phage gp29-like protein
VDAICNMLQNMGSAGWAAFPAGTTLELKEATNSGGDHSPQGELLDRADRYARLVILGQTMSGSQDASKGGGKAFGAVESAVKERRINSAAKYACSVLNSQLIPSILVLNYGDADEAPRVRLLDEDEGGLEEAQRDWVLARSGLEIPKSFLRKKYNLPAPREGEEVIGGSAENAETLKAEKLTPEDPEAEEEIEARELQRLAGIQDDAIFAAELRRAAEAIVVREKARKARPVKKRPGGQTRGGEAVRGSKAIRGRSRAVCGASGEPITPPNSPQS